MTDGRFNRPATAESFQQAGLNDAVGDIFELSGHEFEARYRHVQQLVRARKILRIWQSLLSPVPMRLCMQCQMQLIR